VLEKPGAAAVSDLAAIRDDADAAGVPATAALVQRYGPLPSLLGRLGRLRHLRFSFIAGPPSRYTDAGCGWVLDRSIPAGWTFPDAPGKRYVNYTAVGIGGHVAVDTHGQVAVTEAGQHTATGTVDVDSDALYPIFVEAVAENYDTGFDGMPTLTDLVDAMRPIEESYHR